MDKVSREMIDTVTAVAEVLTPEQRQEAIGNGRAFPPLISAAGRSQTGRYGRGTRDRARAPNCRAPWRIGSMPCRRRWRDLLRSSSGIAAAGLI